MARQRVASVTKRVKARTARHHGRAEAVAAKDNDAHVLDTLSIQKSSPVAEESKKSKKEIDRFEKMLSVDKEALEELVRMGVQQATINEASRQEEISKLLISALAPPSSTGSTSAIDQAALPMPGTYPNTNIAMNRAFTMASKLEDACRTLMNDYATFETTIADMARRHDGKEVKAWTKELRETERLLEVGWRVAGREVRRTLGAEQIEEDRGKEEGAKGDEVTADMENWKGVSKHGDELWRRLRYADRGVKRMAKSISD